MNYQEIINELTKITFKIRLFYEFITYYIQNKNNYINYDEVLTYTINILNNLKIQEEEIYSLLDEDPLIVVKLINLLDKNKNIYQNDETSRLIYRRIMNRLELILLLSDIELIMFGKDYFLKDHKFQFLMKHNLSIDEAISFYQKFKYNFEKSISYRYTTILNNAIDLEKAPLIKDELIKIKLDTVFVRGNELEDDLINSKYTTINNDLENEIKPSFGINPTLKDDFMQIYVLESIINNLKVLINQRTSNLTKQLVFEFKTFILYLNDDNLKFLKDALDKLSFASNNIKNELIKAIINQKTDKLIHMKNNNKTL